jgi:uncharacterized membrane protein YtjA (UPF0391 family)
MALTGILKWALVFFVLALVAAFFGFGGVAAGVVEVARILFFGFFVAAVVALVAGLRSRTRT